MEILEAIVSQKQKDNHDMEFLVHPLLLLGLSPCGPHKF
jgi:hypothetical protein